MRRKATTMRRSFKADLPESLRGTVVDIAGRGQPARCSQHRRAALAKCETQVGTSQMLVVLPDTTRVSVIRK